MYGYIPGLSEKIWDSLGFWVLWGVLLIGSLVYIRFKKRK
ncbi:hypothetical protein Tfer_1879 [Thermincola ferriacetica]|uniref:Uncharacterized protein n=1 Tax=Thermincola ferriacetica TaxID=281456 RepID=A0A0L6W1J6_9FIRM|nr:hypothetical protein Tfer_1879 [Thermincola ferriacetica]